MAAGFFQQQRILEDLAAGTQICQNSKLWIAAVREKAWIAVVRENAWIAAAGENAWMTAGGEKNIDKKEWGKYDGFIA